MKQIPIPPEFLAWLEEPPRIFDTSTLEPGVSTSVAWRAFDNSPWVIAKAYRLDGVVHVEGGSFTAENPTLYKAEDILRLMWRSIPPELRPDTLPVEPAR